MLNLLKMVFKKSMLQNVVSFFLVLKNNNIAYL